jgi:hypothetical protein
MEQEEAARRAARETGGLLLMPPQVEEEEEAPVGLLEGAAEEADQAELAPQGAQMAATPTVDCRAQ